MRAGLSRNDELRERRRRLIDQKSRNQHVFSAILLASHHFQAIHRQTQRRCENFDHGAIGFHLFRRLHTAIFSASLDSPLIQSRNTLGTIFTPTRTPDLSGSMRIDMTLDDTINPTMHHLEGRLSVYAALQARQRKFDVILLKHGMHEESVREILTLASEMNVPTRYAPPAELDAMAHGSSHGGVIAICSGKPRTSLEQLHPLLDSLKEAPFLLLLEGVDDARNLGFTLRTADAMGVHAVLIKKHLWDFDEVEISRPSSGAYERIPLVQIDDVSPLIELQRRGIQLIGCLANAKRTIYEADLKQPTLLAIGGEKRGLSGAVRDICDLFVTIPSKPEPSSLSLSHAGAIIIAEAARQRSHKFNSSPAEMDI
jgi:23S rRNA (guanosine2251-2'-O)-methyltransferase